MPGFDQTGPVGQGPMTGLRMGRCANVGAPRVSEPVGDAPGENIPYGYGRGFGYGRRADFGRGFGFGRGGGRGRGWNRGFVISS